MNKDKLEQEELKILTDEGFSFELKIKEEIPSNHNRFTRLFKRNKAQFVEVNKAFRIEPLRLSTLDRIAKYQSQLTLNEDKIADENNFIVESNSTVARNVNPLASIISLAVLGTNYNSVDFKELNRIFLNALTPKELFRIVNQILILSDHANFINSTRFMMAKSTIKPNEVE